MQIKINGENKTFANNLTVEQLINELELQNKRLAIEVNQELVSRSSFSDYQLNDEDQVEIVHAIGGG